MHTAAAVDANEGIACVVQVDGVHWASLGAFTAMDAKRLVNLDAAAPALGESACGACCDTGRRVAGQTGDGGKACRKAAGRLNADAGGQPGKAVVHEPGAGQGARVASDAAFHVWGGEDLHFSQRLTAIAFPSGVLDFGVGQGHIDFPRSAGLPLSSNSSVGGNCKYSLGCVKDVKSERTPAAAETRRSGWNG